MNKLLKVPRAITSYSYIRVYSSANASPNQPLPSNDDKKNSSAQYNPKNISKEDMNWRTSWISKEDHSNIMDPTRAFYDDTNQVDTLRFLQTPINLSPSAIKKWWNNRQEHRAMMLQSYLPDRNRILGNELAAAHFLVFRGGAIKFHNSDEWIKSDKNNDYNLARFYEPDKILQAIDCSGMDLFYEGLLNLKGLQKLEWASFNEVERLDDWFLDRLSNIFRHSLVYLDIRNCPNYTERGLATLHRMDKLRILCIDDMLLTTSFEMTCLMLQEHNPELQIRIG